MHCIVCEVSGFTKALHQACKIANISSNFLRIWLRCTARRHIRIPLRSASKKLHYNHDA